MVVVKVNHGWYNKYTVLFLMANKISLREIERAIALNSVLDKKASKALTLLKWQNGITQGIPRCVFIYIALKCGYNQEEICDYLAITFEEYNAKAAVLEDLRIKGRDAFTDTSHNSYTNAFHTPLLFYRKLLLAQNYLRYRCGWEVV